MTEKLRLAAAIQAAKWSEMSDALAAAADRFDGAHLRLADKSVSLAINAGHCVENLQEASLVARAVSNRLREE